MEELPRYVATVCEECGKEVYACTFCEQTAYKLAEMPRGTVYFCEDHNPEAIEGEVYIPGENSEHIDIETEWFLGEEVGIYSPTHDCICNYWS